mmetsp:Transcript_31409/g.42483  ORF Transcript_31409/g.42483 Transcript_31409/m.42483 type:complete len:81 (+) Transcript_31409:58-300(+)
MHCRSAVRFNVWSKEHGHLQEVVSQSGCSGAVTCTRQVQTAIFVSGSMTERTLVRQTRQRAFNAQARAATHEVVQRIEPV